MGNNRSVMTVVYLAHPVGGDVERNLVAARELYRRYMALERDAAMAAGVVVIDRTGE